MVMHEYGDEQAPIILALHPMGITGQDLVRTLRPYLAGNYHLLAPDQGGHGRSGPYRSRKEEAAAVKDFLSERGYTKIRLLYGASMGVSTAVELLDDPEIHCERVWLDGGGFSTHEPHGERVIAAGMRGVLRVCRRHPDILARSFARNYGASFATVMRRNFLLMDDEDIVHIFESFACRPTRRIPKTEQENIHLEWGSGDANYRRSKKTVEKLLPAAKVVLREGYGHCNYMAYHTDAYVRELEKFMRVPAEEGEKKDGSPGPPV